ncbi:MAG: radical SAM protein [Holophagaceae bacterium]|nr:radical SAM protein [Holophagaceae bacterium]
MVNTDISRLTAAHLDHRRMWKEFDYCYPVISRRSRGLSLGVNLNPKKECNFRCVYCEVDQQKSSRCGKVDINHLENEMKTLLELAMSKKIFEIHPFSAVSTEIQRINDIAFSGDGEPTLAIEFSSAVQRLAGLKSALGLSDVKMVLITNATNLQDSNVIKGIDTMMANNGEIWAKLDAGTPDYYHKINRSRVELETIIENLIFAGNRWPLTLQTLFLEWEGCPPSNTELRHYINRLKTIIDHGAQIKCLHVYTIARTTPEKKAKALSNATLDQLASDIAKEFPELSIENFYGQSQT